MQRADRFPFGEAFRTLPIGGRLGALKDLEIMAPVYVAVIGGGRASPEIAALAREVGREVARRGAVLICGGLGE